MGVFIIGYEEVISQIPTRFPDTHNKTRFITPYS